MGVFFKSYMGVWKQLLYTQLLFYISLYNDHEKYFEIAFYYSDWLHLARLPYFTPSKSRDFDGSKYRDFDGAKYGYLARCNQSL